MYPATTLWEYIVIDHPTPMLISQLTRYTTRLPKRASIPKNAQSMNLKPKGRYGTDRGGDEDNTLTAPFDTRGLPTALAGQPTRTTAGPRPGDARPLKISPYTKAGHLVLNNGVYFCRPMKQGRPGGLMPSPKRAALADRWGGAFRARQTT